MQNIVDTMVALPYIPSTRKGFIYFELRDIEKIISNLIEADEVFFRLSCRVTEKSSVLSNLRKISSNDLKSIINVSHCMNRIDVFNGPSVPIYLFIDNKYFDG